MECFSFGKIIDFSEGLLEPQEQQALSDHIAAGCGRCRGDADFLKEVIALMRSDRSREVPAAVLDKTLGLFNKGRKGMVVEAIKRQVCALLVFDSGRQPELAGVRSLAGLGKQLLFQAEGFDIDLRFSPTDRAPGESLIGQVLQRDAAAGVADAVVSLATEGKEILLTTTDAFGIFSFRDLPAQKSYDFKILLPDLEINIGVASPS